MTDFSLILASASPRRRELLALTGLPFTVDAPDVNETCTLAPRDAVMELSRRKALAAAELHPGCVILAADTLVAVDDAALGKPQDEADAFRMLKMLSGRWHQVHTGVSVIAPDGACYTEADTTDVHFENMTDEAIRRYIATGEPMDKAGAYAVQGVAGLWIDQLRGSHTNVIGLPMALTRSLLERCGVL
ncbi:MAG: septum formation protein Maf [Clostridia bacterium]|nr:septum formation protein Maf [Clostridia bacterium]